MSGRVFAEPDRDRLVRRLRAVTAGDLSTREIEQLVDGDVSVAGELPLVSRQAVGALLTPETRETGVLEKLVGATLDYVPIAYLELASVAARSVARVVKADRRADGTGTMVSPQLFLTNNHVTPDPAAAAAAIVQFDYELGVDSTPRPVAEFKLDPNRFFWTSPEDELDATLVAIGGPLAGGRRAAEFGRCGLSASADKHAEGDFVTIVQHPEGDFKQIALRENRVIGRGKSGVTLHYGTDTLPGSSGSPVFNDQFELVALHHAGGHRNDHQLENGQAVPDESNEGIRISAIVHRLREVLDDLPPVFRAVLAEALEPPSVQPQVGASRPVVAASPAPAPGHVDVGGGLPLHLVIYASEPAADVAAPAPFPAEPVTTGGLEKNQPPDPDYDRRRGYDPDFLLPGRTGAAPVTVPVPKLPKSLLATAAVPKEARRTAGGVLLRYLHFSIVQNADRRMPYFTAVNIDGRRARSINRETGEVEVTETWFVDPRLAPDEQLAQSVFDRQKPRLFDRGHMVRRLDPAWGSAPTARRASDDTFHFTNCAPQISAFNQRAALWAGIENFVLDNAKVERLRVNVFTGPVFGESDPEFRGIRVPRAFWKLLVRLEDGKLRCTAFRADQGTLLDAGLAGSQPEAFSDLGKVALFQVGVSQVERETGLGFGNLAAHDTRSLESPSGTPVGSLDDVEW
ncbi:MAG TPA: DNA/RNA non-specific endonuclease [Acidimicrobiales bacterium]|nr:DNA/RNA non-specific endonuclease [Acidimicrobiales bacterium]